MEKEVLQKYKEAGSILTEALQYGKGLIEPGVPVLEVCDKVEDKIKELGGDIAFPAQLSRNEVAAHACPRVDEETVCEEGDLIKLDIGVHQDGYIADSAVTVNLGDHDELVKAAEEALTAALKVAGPGVKVSEVGKEIQGVIESYDYAPVRNLSGHGLGRFIVHQKPNIPNYDNGSDFELEEGMVVAIEPFASEGAGIIYESEHATVYMMQDKKPVRNRMARNILKDIEDYNGLPFASRWLARKHSLGTVKIGMRELLQKGVVEDYPPLIDKQDGLIAQAEHTIIVKDDPIIITKN